MPHISASPAELRRAKLKDYVTRFLFGAAVTLLAGLISRWAGPVVGGLFLAFPGIFPPGISYVEEIETEKMQQAGLHGTARARTLASVHAAGASEGTFGLIAFAAVLWWLLPRHGLALGLSLATLTWTLVSLAAWYVRERL